MSRTFAHLARLFNRSSDPVGAGPGDTWYRSDRAQLHTSDGQGSVTIGPTGNLPVVRAGAWHSLPAYGASSTVTPLLNQAYALPFWPGQKCTLSSVSAEVTLLGIGNLRFGLYADSNSRPGALISDFGTVSTGLLGVKTLATNQPLRPVLYWLIVAQQGLVSVGLRSRATSEPMVSLPSPVFTGNTSAYVASGISGALPSTFPSSILAVQGPAAMVQLS